MQFGKGWMHCEQPQRFNALLELLGLWRATYREFCKLMGDIQEGPELFLVDEDVEDVLAIEDGDAGLWAGAPE